MAFVAALPLRPPVKHRRPNEDCRFLAFVDSPLGRYGSPRQADFPGFARNYEVNAVGRSAIGSILAGRRKRRPAGRGAGFDNEFQYLSLRRFRQAAKMAPKNGCGAFASWQEDA
jgi:hypothetical protein